MIDLSVVIPLHNASRYICATLDSFAAQTSPPREVIVVDDGSTDGGGEIAGKYQFADGSHPIVIRNDNVEGVARARNRGVFHSKWDWIALCDSDDLWHPRRIEMMAAAVDTNPGIHAVATQARAFALESDRLALEHHQRGAMVALWIPDDRIETLVEHFGTFENSKFEEITYRDIQLDATFLTTVVCMRKEVYAIAGGCAPWSFRADDYLLHAGVLIIGPIPMLTAPLVFYRVRPSSQSHDDSESALPLLAAALATRYGGEVPDTRPEGAFYRHLVGVDARRGAPLSRTLAFAALGDMSRHEVLTLLRVQAKRHLPKWARSHFTP